MTQEAVKTFEKPQEKKKKDDCLVFVFCI